ncbi:MAG: Jag N-terminal domain-containing protein [Deltaproteobacteria bacterium]|nr:Jag N-terminal domain-containing protein [Deltaproteobacteria bacterium]
MRSVEVEGGSIDEAIDRALHALGAVRDQVEIDILENATQGLLGIGRRPARVRATMRAPFVAMDGGSDPAFDLENDTPAATRMSPVGGEVARAVAAPSAERFDGAAFVDEVLRRMSLEARVQSSADARGGCVLEIESADAAVIAACRDEVLAALEFLVNRIAERHAKEKPRFTIAIAGRRARGDLATLARRLAERARARGKAVTVDARGEDERRVVLEALHGERGITVRTTGGGPQRKLIIVPGGRRRRGGGTTDR